MRECSETEPGEKGRPGARWRRPEASGRGSRRGPGGCCCGSGTRTPGPALFSAAWRDLPRSMGRGPRGAGHPQGQRGLEESHGMRGAEQQGQVEPAATRRAHAAGPRDAGTRVPGTQPRARPRPPSGMSSRPNQPTAASVTRAQAAARAQRPPRCPGAGHRAAHALWAHTWDPHPGRRRQCPHQRAPAPAKG